MICAFKNLNVDRTSQSADAGIRASIFNSCNDASVWTRECENVKDFYDILFCLYGYEVLGLFPLFLYIYIFFDLIN